MGQVHLYRTRLTLEPPFVEKWYGMLEEPERARAERFRFGDHRRRYIIAHGALRMILSQYLHKPPDLIRFKSSQFGKPSLDPSGGNSVIRFSMSTSGDYGLYAFSIASELGVDIEQQRHVPDATRIARSYFTQKESDLIGHRESSARDRLFLRLWTRKEAVVKGEGGGLSIPLNKFDVSDESSPANGVKVSLTRMWHVFDINCGTDFVAAVAVHGSPVQFECFEWN
jgi:4'-phosphopantetheinyl transferase